MHGLTKTIEPANFHAAKQYDYSEPKILNVSTTNWLLSLARVRVAAAPDKTQTTQTVRFLVSTPEFRQAHSLQDILNRLSDFEQQIEQATVQIQADTELSRGVDIFSTQSEVLQNLDAEEMYELHTTFAEGAAEGTLPEEDGNHLADIFLHAAADAGHHGAIFKLQQMNFVQVNTLDTANETKRSDKERVQASDVLRDITKLQNKTNENSREATKKLEDAAFAANVKKAEESKLAAQIKARHLLDGRKNLPASAV